MGYSSYTRDVFHYPAREYFEHMSLDSIVSGLASFTQSDRLLKLKSPLGDNVLLPERLKMVEGISTLFEMKITVRSTHTSLKASDIIGKLVDLSVESNPLETRTWNGLVTSLREGPMISRGLRAYTLIVRPQLWLMSQKSDCRIWMDKTSVEVAQILCEEHGLPTPKISTLHP